MPNKSAPKIMLDLESVSQKTNGAIISIGAVKFGNGKIFDRFYRVISIESCKRYGLHIDSDTLKWWSEQPPAARQILRDSITSGVDLKDALIDLEAFIFSPDVEFWANGISFDAPMLENAYEAVGMKWIVHWWNYRDARTIFALQPKEEQMQRKVDRQNTYHNALDDAIEQAENLMHILEI